MTPQQRKQIRTGQRKITEAANRAMTYWYYSCTIEGTFYSVRGKRTNRGKEIN